MSRAPSSVRYASRVTGVDFEKYLVWGGIAAAIYFVAWPVLKTALAIKNAAGEGIDSARGAVASGLYRLFGPEDNYSGANRIVTFPDGSRHQVPAAAINNQGLFKNTGDGRLYKGDGKNYFLVVNKNTGAYVAVPA